MSDQPNKPAQAVLALWDAVREDFDAAWVSTPESERIKAVCLKMCEAGGHKPDDIVMGYHHGAHYEPCRGPNGSVHIRFPLLPVWATFWGEAQAAIAAIDAVDGRAT